MTGYGAEKNLVPDAPTAVRIAEAVVLAARGPDFLAQYAPLQATADQQYWRVMSANIVPGQRGGGGPELEIARKDGQIVSFRYAR